MQKIFKIVLLLAVFFAFGTAGGCGSKKVEETGDAVADEFTGYRPIKQGERLKDRIRKIDEQRQEQEKKARNE